MYPRADSRVPDALVVPQKVVCVPTSSKSVPPTATLNGVEAKPPTASPKLALDSELKLSQPAEAPSPADINTEIPCAAASSHIPRKNWLPAAPNAASHSSKLSFITGAILLSMM